MSALLHALHAHQPLPECFIQARRHAEERPAPKIERDTLQPMVERGLRDEITAALMGNPATLVRTPGYKAGGAMSAADLFLEDYAGTDADLRAVQLVQLVAAAAKGEDVKVRAQLILSSLIERFVAFHAGDALIEAQQ